MKTNTFLSVTDNPNLIPGIYNYCDRWCERCTMTHRCSVFLTTPDLDPDDFENEEAFLKAVFESIHESFQTTRELLQSFVKQENINLGDIDANDSEPVEITPSGIKDSPLSRLSLAYADLGRAWLKTAGPSLLKVGEELKQASFIDLPGRQPEQEVLTLRDALDVIPFHLHQIHVKLVRAQSGRLRNDAWFEENHFPKDSDGSAKVALIGIDRSIKAWSTLLPYLPEEEESILPILSNLNQLRDLVEATFPAARSFKRPGFDDM